MKNNDKNDQTDSLKGLTVLTVPEVAKQLRVGKNRVYEMVASNEIEHRRCGRRILIAAWAVDNYLKGGASK